MTPFKFRDCACPGEPHPDGDTVTFRAELPFKANAAALLAIVASGEASGAMDIYLHHGPESWNLVDEDGEPVPLVADALDALPFPEQFAIANHGDTLYSETVISPLVRANAKSSETGPTGDTSQDTKRSSKRRARS